MKLTQNLISTFNSYSDICRYIGYPLNGSGTRKAKKDCEPFDTSHFDRYKSSRDRRKYLKVTKECPVCSKEFETLKGHPKETTTCSYGCSNTHFRSNENHGSWKGGVEYRKLAFKHLPHQCSECGFNQVPEVLHVHHKDRDRANSSLSNLKILCPTCHEVEHFQNGDGKWGSKSQ
jgi:5-methylcytosine-specific restriction endonuclease McrA